MKIEQEGKNDDNDNGDDVDDDDGDHDRCDLDGQRKERIIFFSSSRRHHPLENHCAERCHRRKRYRTKVSALSLKTKKKMMAFVQFE